MMDEQLPCEIGDNDGKYDIDWNKVVVLCIPQQAKAIRWEDIPFMEMVFRGMIRAVLIYQIKTALFESNKTVEQFDRIGLVFVTTKNLQDSISMLCRTDAGTTVNPSRIQLFVESENLLTVMVFLQWFNEAKQSAEQFTGVKSNCTIEQFAAFIRYVGDPIIHISQEKHEELNNL
jgi:hypothetical protein